MLFNENDRENWPKGGFSAVGFLFSDRLLEKDRDVWDIPMKQRRSVAKSLSEIKQKSVDRNTAIKIAYVTASYSQREIGEHFHLHLSTVGVIVKRGKDS